MIYFNEIMPRRPAISAADLSTAIGRVRLAGGDDNDEAFVRRVADELGMPVGIFVQLMQESGRPHAD